MNLRDKYNHAIQVAKGFRMQGAAEERDGKLYFNYDEQSREEWRQNTAANIARADRVWAEQQH